MQGRRENIWLHMSHSWLKTKNQHIALRAGSFMLPENWKTSPYSKCFNDQYARPMTPDVDLFLSVINEVWPFNIDLEGVQKWLDIVYRLACSLHIKSCAWEILNLYWRVSGVYRFGILMLKPYFHDKKTFNFWKSCVCLIVCQYSDT